VIFPFCFARSCFIAATSLFSIFTKEVSTSTCFWRGARAEVLGEGRAFPANFGIAGLS